MSETVKDLEGAVEVFEGVLQDYGVISKAEAEAMVEKAKKDLHKADEASVVDDAEEFGESGELTVTELKERLPEDMWELVRTYLAGDGSDLPDKVEASEPGGDVEKAVNSAITESGATLSRVRGNVASPVTKSDNEPSYESSEAVEVSPGDMVLKHLDEELGTPLEPMNKGKSKSDNPALSHIDEEL